MPDREIGVEDDPVQAVVAAVEQFSIPLTEVIGHGLAVGLHSPVVPSCPKGPRSRACLGSGVEVFLRLGIQASEDDTRRVLAVLT